MLKPQYFFEPLIKTELDLLAKDKGERELMLKIVLYHLLFTFYSHTPENLHQTLTLKLKDDLYDFNLIDKLSALNPKINQEVIERALQFILSQIQTRLENSLN